MPTVIGINEVPRNIVRPKWYEDYGYGQGALARAILLAIAGGGGGGGIGQVPTTPTPSRPGTLTFPSGATTPTSPQELTQLQALGGVPSRQGTIVPFGQPQTGGVSYTQPTRIGFRPDLTYQTNQLAIQKAQRELDPNSPENVLKTQTASLYKAYADQVRGVEGQGQSPFGGTPDVSARVSELIDAAESGDETAILVLRELGVL